MFAIASITAVAKNEKSMTWRGYIVFFHDSAGGVKNANSAAGEDCAMQYFEQEGASWVFVDVKSKKLFKIHNQDIVNTDNDLGMKVTVTGHVTENGMLHVDKISTEIKMQVRFTPQTRGGLRSRLPRPPLFLIAENPFGSDFRGNSIGAHIWPKSLGDHDEPSACW